MTTVETAAPDAAPKKVKQTAEEKAAIKATKDAEKAEAKAKKEAEKVAAAPKAKDTQNGITRPGVGVTRKVWDMADALSKEKPTERAPLVEALKGQVEVGTIHTQYGRWRKYYDLTETKEERQARLAVARDAKNAVKAAEKEAKAKDKAAKAAAKAEADRVKAEQKAAAEAAAEAAKQAEAQPA